MSGDPEGQDCHTYRIASRRAKTEAAPDVMDLAAIRERLGASQGREYWRSLEEAADTPAVQDMLHREFPSRASEWNDPVGRREFLRVMGASLALAGVGACTRQPDEKIVPYVRQPEIMVPGRPLFFATAMPVDGYATGLIVESHTGRPTKIEGNPTHPASLGATSAIVQAAILSLYDPDRAKGVTTKGGAASDWDKLVAALQTALGPIRDQKGKGLHFLTETTSSPTLARQMQELLKALPEAKWHQYSPVNRDNAVAGARLAFGSVVEPIYHFDKADTIVSLDADFLDAMPGSVRYARDFVSRRKVGPGAPTMTRLYVLEATPSVTGARADHRLPLRPAEIEAFARALAAQVSGVTAPTDGLSEGARHWLEVVGRDLQQHRGTSLLLAGPTQPPAVHALVHATNQALGNAGATVSYIDPVEADPAEREAALRDLAVALESGSVAALVVIGANPAYAAPADLKFASKMQKAGFSVVMSQHVDETASLAQWHVAQAHFLEEWSDARAFDGTASIVQPLIAPLFDARSPHELVAAVAGGETSSYKLVRATWQAQFNAAPAAQRGEAGLTFDRWWRRLLNDGIIPNTARAPRTMKAGATAALPAPTAAVPGIEVIFRPDTALYDGRHANNGWLQELPRPTTKLTWDNAVLVSPRTAERLGITTSVAFTGGEHGQTISPLLELKSATGTVRVPAWITPGQPDDCLTLHLGYGRSSAGRVGNGVGVDAGALRTTASPWSGGTVTVTLTGDKVSLASTQAHNSMEGRDLVRSGSLAEYRADPTLAKGATTEAPPRELSLYPETPSAGYAWAMTIDLSQCIGCNACIIGCQAENNIPVVGRKEVLRGREMHWIRVDRYHTGPLDAPDTHFQPVPCMHCEDAPCETVCPVNATMHSDEGLNEMVYNRCVGTRYCSNNCPYKVRRFNFFKYDDWKTPSVALMRNPDVSVRSRGVMEKCSYCVQRISSAKIDAEKEGRDVRDGDIVTACQAVCPTNAIIFGNQNDANSRVAQAKRDPRNYGLLAQLNTRPRTTYLADVRNPNPEL